MPKIALHTHFTNSWEDLASITIPNTQRYADKHGYEFHVEKYNDGNVDFVKTKTALKLLNEYDLVFCLEADMLITNHTIKVESFIDDYYDFYICMDVNNINFGSCIVKNTSVGKLILNDINDSEGTCKTEQNYLENEAWHIKMKILKHPSINSIPYNRYHNYGYINYNGQPEPTHEQGNWEKGDFIMHLPGQSMDARVSIFTNHLKDIIYE